MIIREKISYIGYRAGENLRLGEHYYAEMVVSTPVKAACGNDEDMLLMEQIHRKFLVVLYAEAHLVKLREHIESGAVLDVGYSVYL